MKTCFKCGLTKPLSEFYKHPQMGDGHLGKCKECTNHDTRANVAMRSEQYAEYERRRFQTPERKAYAKKQQEIYRARHPEKYMARNKFRRAVRDGLIVCQPCVDCGSTENVHGHHEDYSHPLDVTWLCRACHWQRHAELKQAAV